MKPDEQVGLRYQLVKQHHVSWMAVDQVSGQNCVLKPLSSFIDPSVADFLESVWHPGLPRLIDRVKAGADEGGQTVSEYLVFEYCQGISLSDLAAENDGRLSAAQLLPVMKQAAGILAYLHQQGERPLFHLDIKPEHLIVGPDGQVSLIDFGAARFSQCHTDDKFLMTAGLMPEQAACGLSGAIHALTPEFAAPEQRMGRPCEASDIYALGLTMLHLLSGQPASTCRRAPIHELLQDLQLPPDLERLAGRCLLADPAARLHSAHDFLAEIGAETIITTPSETNANPREFTGSPAPVICIWGNAEFGCELAGCLSEKQEVLVIDADLMNPQADLLLGCWGAHQPDAPDYQQQGLDLALSEVQRGHLDAPALRRMAQPSYAGRISVLAARADLDRYEYYDLDSFERVLRLSRLISRSVVVLCSRFIFDAFTCLCMMSADSILVARNGDSGSFRECSRSLRFLISKQKLDARKIYFAAFDYRPAVDLSRSTLNELCGGRLIGSVSPNDKRRAMKSGAVPFAAALDRANRSEYRSIIRYLRIGPEMAAKKVKESV